MSPIDLGKRYLMSRLPRTREDEPLATALVFGGSMSAPHSRG